MILLKKYILYSWLFIALVAFIVNNKNNYYNNKGLFYVAVLLRIAIVQLSNIYWTYHSLTYSLIEFIYDWFVQRMSMLRTHIVPYSAQLPIRFISTRLLEDWLSFNWLESIEDWLEISYSFKICQCLPRSTESYTAFRCTKHINKRILLSVTISIILMSLMI